MLKSEPVLVLFSTLAVAALPLQVSASIGVTPEELSAVLTDAPRVLEATCDRACAAARGFERVWALRIVGAVTKIRVVAAEVETASGEELRTVEIDLPKHEPVTWPSLLKAALQPDTPEVEKISRFQAGPWIFIGTGILASGTGVFFAASSNGARSELKSADSNDDILRASDRLEDQGALGRVFLAAGAGVIFTGALWLILGE